MIFDFLVEIFDLMYTFFRVTKWEVETDSKIFPDYLLIFSEICWPCCNLRKSNTETLQSPFCNNTEDFCDTRILHIICNPIIASYAWFRGTKLCHVVYQNFIFRGTFPTGIGLGDTPYAFETNPTSSPSYY